jgi:hypothetical protein
VRGQLLSIAAQLQKCFSERAIVPLPHTPPFILKPYAQASDFGSGRHLRSLQFGPSAREPRTREIVTDIRLYFRNKDKMRLAKAMPAGRGEDVVFP